MSPNWKGKARARDDSADYGNGGEGGIILPLDMIYTATYDAVYTVPITVGTQTLSIQVDTGSSDLWFAASSCSSQACKQTNGKLYDPSQAKQTGQPFKINYVEGVVSGPIVWDTVHIGGYEIDSQALAAATTVDSEPLTPDFTGVLGLALPLNSIISSAVPPTTSSAPDGAVLASNLFSMSPSFVAPSYRFISLTLARPDGGASSVPSLLGIGRHPPVDVVPDPSKVQYSSVAVSSEAVAGSSPHYWQTLLNGISVYVDGARKPIDVGGSATAIIDSGMPVILARADIANGIYGALGIGPGSDGQYYVPCTTPLNMSVSLDSRSDIPVHPLDLTYSGQAFSGSLSTGSSLTSGATVSSGSSNSMCLGLIQAYPAGQNLESLADVILGVPFMRSVYTVMAYDTPDMNGAFPNASASLNQMIRPKLGLLGLIDPTVALDEFNKERVLNEPLPSQPSSGNNGGSGSTGSRSRLEVPSKKLSVGVEVLIGIVGFFALLAAVFGIWWLTQRKRRQRERRDELARSMYDDGGIEDNEKLMGRDAIYMLARRSTLSSRYGPSEDTLRAQKFEDYLKRRESDMSTERTRTLSEYGGDTLTGNRDSLVPPLPDKERHSFIDETELGFIPPRNSQYYSDEPTLINRPDEESRLINEYPPSPMHTRTPTLEADVAVPLLAHTRTESAYDPHAHPRERSALGMGRPSSRARVGSFGDRGSIASFDRTSTGSFGERPHPHRTVSGPRPISSRRTSSSSSVGSSARRTSDLLASSPPPPLPSGSAISLHGERSPRLATIPASEESMAGHDP
ncbi:A1 family peptidase [Phanerochaete sordida]|uniref:A1 family peptidase n=1 Tax=Phanerochaete sordida TaxID=48140 RepID=A0A9P3G989_9APHY|nr:A1 family peptidase [Phanerochaete sordida]